MSDEPEYSLVRLRNGAFSVHARTYAETMHPGVGPAEEAEALYVHQTGLLERMREPDGEFVVWDIGLGAAANVLTVLRCAREIPVELRVLSFDNTDLPLRFARENCAALPYFRGFEDTIDQLLRERHAVPGIRKGRTDWRLIIDDFPTLLGQAEAASWPKPHLILYDPFSPARNPAMWTLPLFERLFGLLDPARPCVMPTYSRSTMLRVTLLLAGFYVGVGQGTGTKEETTIAANRMDLVKQPLDGRWLERARRSNSAIPLTDPVYRRRALDDSTWERLRRLPQF